MIAAFIMIAAVSVLSAVVSVFIIAAIAAVTE